MEREGLWRGKVCGEKCREGRCERDSVWRGKVCVKRYRDHTVCANTQQDVVKEYVGTLSIDKLPSLMEFLRGLLTTQDERSLVIYTHCEVCACVRDQR